MPDTPNTVTSPEQAGVVSLLNLARPSTDGSGALPLQPGVDKLMEVMMRGMANVRSENAASTTAKDAASAPSPTISTTTKVDPKTGQQVHKITYDGVMFGDAQQNVQDAYDGPQKGVDAELQQSAIRHQREVPGANGALPADLQQASLDSFAGKYRAMREAGHGPLSALIHSAVVQALPNSLERSREAELAKTDNNRRQLIETASLKNELPIIGEIDRQRRIDEQAKKDAGLASRFEVRDLRTLISKTNLADQPDETSAIAKIAGDKGIDPAELQGWAVQRVKDKWATDREAARANTVKLFRKDTKGLGQFPTQQAAETSLGVPLKPSERASFNADYSAAREETLRTRQNELFKVRSDARAADAAGRSADASARAAARDTGKTVDAGMLISGKLTPDDLLRRRGNAKYDQDSVEAAISAGAEHYSQAIYDRNAQIEAIDQITSTSLEGVTPDKALTAREKFAQLKSQKQKLMAANERDVAAFNKLHDPSVRAVKPSGGAPTVKVQPVTMQPVVVGTRGSVVKVGGEMKFIKTATNPATGERQGFDGKKWVPIP